MMLRGESWVNVTCRDVLAYRPPMNQIRVVSLFGAMSWVNADWLPERCQLHTRKQFDQT